MRNRDKKTEDGNERKKVKENKISQNNIKYPEAAKAMNRTIVIRSRTEH